MTFWDVQKIAELLTCLLVHFDLSQHLILACEVTDYWISAVLRHQMLNGEKCVKISLDVEAKLNSVGKRASSLAWITKILLRFSQASLHIIADHKPLLALSVNTVQPYHRYLPGSDDSTCFCPHVITACLFEKHTHMMTQMLWAGCLPPYHLSKRIPS